MTISFRLDGKPVSVDVEPMQRLLDVLRLDLGITEVKEGCGEGECGACVVFVDGRLVNSCITAVGAVADREVVTIRSIRETDAYHVIEQAFSDAGAVQCGFCTPGMIMAALALLKENPRPTDDEIRHALAGNLCRCTGYNMIVDGVRLAAERGTAPW